MSKAIREAQRYDAPHEYVEQSAHGCYVHVDDHTAIVEELRTQLAAAEREIFSLTEIARCETAFAMAAYTRAEGAEAELRYIRRAFRGAVESDALAITYQTIGSYRAGLLKTLNALDTTHNGGPA